MSVATITPVKRKTPVFKIIFAALAVIVVVFLVVVAIQPSHFRVVRSASISASPAAVFAQVNDFRKWEAWSPWAKKDPAARNWFEGPSEGTGSVFAWSGNSEVGEGRMTILESRPSDLIRIKLDFLKPFESTATTEYTFKPEGNQTVMTWSMTGEKNFMSKAVCMFMNMDKMVGGDFEQAMANIKAVTEGAAPK